MRIGSSSISTRALLLTALCTSVSSFSAQPWRHSSGNGNRPSLTLPSRTLRRAVLPSLATPCLPVLHQQQHQQSAPLVASSTTTTARAAIQNNNNNANDINNENDSRTTAASTRTTTAERGAAWKTTRGWTAALAVLAAAVAAPSTAAAAVDWTTTAAATASVGKWWSSLVETGFYQAFSLVFVSEIGDKTFFIAGLLAMKTSRLISFIGSIGALAAMTIVSVIIGQVFHVVPSGFAEGIPLDDIAAVLAFTFFGLKTLKEALELEEGASTMDEELADAQEAVQGSQTINEVTAWGQIASIFALVFAAEFGDRSFLSTIALSAAQNPASVAGGAIVAHAAATGIAVSGGALVSKYISEKAIGIIGGTLFLIFAVTTALGIF